MIFWCKTLTFTISRKNSKSWNVKFTAILLWFSNFAGTVFKKHHNNLIWRKNHKNGRDQSRAGSNQSSFELFHGFCARISSIYWIISLARMRFKESIDFTSQHFIKRQKGKVTIQNLKCCKNSWKLNLQQYNEKILTTRLVYHIIWQLPFL